MKNLPVGKIGVGITVVYFIGLCIAIHCYALNRFDSYNSLGDFLAGAFSPVAFLWLVLGFFQQQKELQQNTDALKLQAQELQNSVEQYKEMVAVAQKQLDSDITKVQEERRIRENETKPMVMLNRLRFQSSFNGFFTYRPEIQTDGREAKNVLIEFIGGFGKYKSFKCETLTTSYLLPDNKISEQDLPQEVIVHISYESVIGKKYKYQYMYFNLVNGGYQDYARSELVPE